MIPGSWSVVAHGSYFLGLVDDPSDVDVLVATRDRGLSRDAVAARVVELLDPVARSLPIDVDIANPDWLSVMERAVILGGKQIAGPPLEVPPITSDEWASYLAAVALTIGGSEPAAACLCALRALWASEGRMVIPKSAVPSEAAGSQWEDLAAKAWPERHGPGFTHPDLEQLLALMPSIAVPAITMDDLVATCRTRGGHVLELIDAGIASLPGQTHGWRHGRAQEEPPAALFDWWTPPHPDALTPAVCEGLIHHRGTPQERDGSPWRCDAWNLEAPTGLTEKVTTLVELANTLWWRFDLTAYHYSIHRYGPGHAHPAHHDMLPGSMSRKLSLSIQLSPSDAYEGGDLELLVGGDWHPAPRDRGTVVAMPGWLSHRVAPITGGERWSLVVSCYGPPVR